MECFICKFSVNYLVFPDPANLNTTLALSLESFTENGALAVFFVCEKCTFIYVSFSGSMTFDIEPLWWPGLGRITNISNKTLNLSDFDGLFIEKRVCSGVLNIINISTVSPHA